jgi:hypothetical protein
MKFDKPIEDRVKEISRIGMFADESTQHIKPIKKANGAFDIEATAKAKGIDLTTPPDGLEAGLKGGPERATIIDPDLLKKRAQDFDPKHHELYSAAAKKMYAKALRENPNSKVVFTAGGPASGKSAPLLRGLPSDFDGIVVDGVMADFDSAYRKIITAKKAGKKVEVDAVLANIEDAWERAQLREIKTGRGVPVDVFADKYIGFSGTIHKIAKNHPEIPLRIKDTRGINSKQDAINAPYVEDKDEILDILREMMYTEDRKGKIIRKLKKIKPSKEAQEKARQARNLTSGTE